MENICKHLSAHQEMTGQGDYGDRMPLGEERRELPTWRHLSHIVPSVNEARHRTCALHGSVCLGRCKGQISGDRK